MSKSIKLDVFGKHILARRTSEGWSLYYVSDDGKRRPAFDIFVPNSVNESEIESFLADIYHEWATDINPDVRRLNR